MLLIILAIAIFFRFYKLAEIPPGLYPDVAVNGNNAIDALKAGEFKVFYPDNNGREGLFMNLIAFGFAIFGISVWALKFVPATIGTLTVLGMYLMVRELFSQYQEVGLPREVRLPKIEIIALSSTFFLAASFWHILFSRLGFRAIMVPFFLVWSFYFLVKATRMMRIEHADDTDKKTSFHSRFAICYWLLAGLLFGLGFHTYIAFRVAPLILGMILLIEFYNYWPRFKLHITKRISLIDSFRKIYIKDGWWKWDIFFIAIIAAVLPLAIYFYNNPQDFMGRSAQVSIFASENPVKQLAITTVKTLGMFNIWGDCNWRHNYACRPELFWPVGILFLIGLFMAIKKVLRPIFLVIARKSRDRGRGDDKAISSSDNPAGLLRGVYPELNRRTRNDDLSMGVWSPAQISLFLLTWFFAMLLPAILTNEGLPHALRAIGAIPPVFIFAGMGGWWIIEKIISVIARRSETTKQSRWNPTGSLATLGMTLGVIFALLILLQSYKSYFLDWGKNHEVQGAYTQHFVDVGNYLNSLPENTKKYVIVNEEGVFVPYPDGPPMPAQTVMFIEKTSSKAPKTTYLKPEQIDSVQISKTQSATVVVPMKYDEPLFDSLKQNFPQGQIKQKDNIWTFQIQN